VQNQDKNIEILDKDISIVQNEIKNYDAEISSLQAPTSMIGVNIPAKKKQELLIRFNKEKEKKQKELDDLIAKR
jgi:hypothetical protein